ncbi:Hypothetical protein R9X50_00508400 [Acrodontium crateriforme]|uniref:Transcription initiation factor IIE subunit beta n=1 Tax=Acrodontium crateriforme TaxID=150365 RepID=A0AAQ3M8Q9_9PEZI|nr:Hypothetical protein R9X50_00508400 [Acrodontium crateriforme]
MSLSASLHKYKSELADTAARNTQFSRPAANAPPRTSTPKPATSGSGEKRGHDAAFPVAPPAAGQTTAPGGRELMTQVYNAVNYLKDKNFQPITFDNLISYLSLPHDAQKNIPLIKRALQGHDRVDFVPKAQSGLGKDAFRYRSQHPVSNGEELLSYLARRETAKGINVKELKDGWPDCMPTIDRLEGEGHLLVIRNKKDNTPKTVWPDSPNYHLVNPHPTAGNRQVGKVDTDFVDFWHKTKVPSSENDIRTELERAGITPTSAVKEMRKSDNKKKERKRVVRRNGKTTNSHMLGILKEYPGKRG